MTPDEQIDIATRNHVKASDELNNINARLSGNAPLLKRKAELEAHIGQMREVMAGRTTLEAVEAAAKAAAEPKAK